MPPKTALGVKTSTVLTIFVRGGLRVLSYVSTCILQGKPNDASSRLCGAMVARLTPDQKAACSSHVGVKFFPFTYDFQGIIYAAYGTKQSTCLISSQVSLNLLQYSHFVLFRERSQLFAV